jgi:hypothetical protein
MIFDEKKNIKELNGQTTIIQLNEVFLENFLKEMFEIFHVVLQ